MQEVLREEALPAIDAVVGNGGEALPADVGRMASVEDDGIVVADARDAACLRENVPELGVVCVVHAVPGLVRVLGKHADQAFEELVAVICKGEARQLVS